MSTVEQLLAQQLGLPQQSSWEGFLGQNKSIPGAPSAWGGVAQAPAAQQVQQAPQKQLPLTGYSTGGMSTRDSDAILKKINEQGLTSRKQQETGLGDIEGLISQLEGAPLPTGLAAVDLTPFAAAVDAMTGSNLSAVASKLKKPETAQERKMNILGLKQIAQKGKSDITDKDLDLLKMQLQNAQQKEMFQYGLQKEGMALAKQDKPTAAQFDTGGYAHRLRQAEEVFNSLGQSGYDRTSREQSLKSGLFGEAQSPELKSWGQAERNFINAVLRRESGASISPTEFSSAEQQYFPRPGDTPDVLAQKAANRAQVFETLKAGSGSAYGQIPTISGKGSAPLPKEGDAYTDEKGGKWKAVNKDGKLKWVSSG